MKNFILFYTFIAFLGIFSASAQSKKSLPQFAFEDLKGGVFSHENINKKLPTVVVFFDPYCDHCQQEATWIRQMENSFKNINLIWVSTEEAPAISKFRDTYFKGTILTNLYFLKDAKYRFDGYFGYSVAPSVYVYNKAGFLTQSFDKETLPADLLNAARE